MDLPWFIRSLEDAVDQEDETEVHFLLSHQFFGKIYQNQPRREEKRICSKQLT